MARRRLLLHRASLVPILLVLLLCSSTAARASATTTMQTPEGSYHRWSRKLLVTEPRVSPETPSASASSPGEKQEMDVGGWRTATPFRRAGASLGRRVPGSHANPSHN